MTDDFQPYRRWTPDAPEPTEPTIKAPNNRGELRAGILGLVLLFLVVDFVLPPVMAWLMEVTR
jgi:hypothetical protein